jgi:16S rRNA (uracil1498-N3)-methyltransferase
VDDALRRSAAHVLVADVDAPLLDDAAAHHLSRVLRLRDGAAVSVTDGAGRWRSCHLVSDALETGGDVEQEPPPPDVTVAVAPPKGDRLEWLVQKCTEVGVTGIVLLDAERSVVRWEGDRAARQLERLQRIALEAAMQSRRVWLPDVCGPVGVATVLPGAVVAEPGGRPVGPGDAVVAVGPEGGWSPDEVAMAAGRVDLGPHVLRVETAAVVAATLMVAAGRR